MVYDIFQHLITIVFIVFYKPINIRVYGDAGRGPKLQNVPQAIRGIRVRSTDF